jgi:hypothetical protein
VAGIAATALGYALNNELNHTNNTEVVQVQELLEDRLRGPAPVTETIVVHSPSATADDPEFQAVVPSTIAALAAQPEIVAQVTDPLEAVAAGAVPESSVVSEDRHTVITR